MLLSYSKNILQSVVIVVFANCNPIKSINNFKQKLLLKGSNNLQNIFYLETKSFCLKTNMDKVLPFYASGEIVRGFGRGSKDLGMPTANFPANVVKTLPSELNTGVYYGWANIDNGDVHKMVMSIGWNPFYQNKEKSMETHILYNYNKELYGCLLKVCIVGHLRPEQNFNSLDDLIAAIKNDISQATNLLEKEEALKLKEMEFFKQKTEKMGSSLTPIDTVEDSVKVNGEKL